MNNTVKFGLNLQPGEGDRLFNYKGLSSELTYMNDAGTFGTLVKLNSNLQNPLYWEQIGYMHKFGDHTFGVDTRWDAPPRGGDNNEDAPEDAGSAYGFKSLTVYGQTKVSDDWTVGMSLRPTMNMMGLSQEGACSVGMNGRINDQLSMSAVTNGETANVTATYRPSNNVDVQMTNEWNLEEVSQNGLNLSQLKPAFTVNLHD